MRHASMFGVLENGVRINYTHMERLIPLFLLLAHTVVSAQPDENKSQVLIETGVFQTQHNLNYDLVFSGGYLGLGYQSEWWTDRTVLIYTADLRFAAMQNKGIAFHWQLSPVYLSYAWKIDQLCIGPYTSLNYMWQQHPQVQGGRVFWLTAIELGLATQHTFHINQTWIKGKALTSVAGFCSSTSPSVEEHYFSLRFSDIIGSSHENFELHTVQNYIHIKIGAEVALKKTSRLSLGYDFEYYHSSSLTNVKVLFHSLLLNYLINKR